MRGLTAAMSAAVVAALAMSGCAVKGDDPDLVAGKQQFVQKCGSCHTLARANTKGTIGPDLDEAFQRAKVDGFGQDTIRDVVKKQIEYPSIPGDKGTGVMPAKLVTGDKAQDVAAYVAQSAAAGGKDTGLLAIASGGGSAKDPKALFAQGNGTSTACGSCHKLADAGTSGTIGPDLDKVLPGMSVAMIKESIVKPEAKITKGFPANVMPGDFAKTLKPAEVDALAKYLVKVTKK